MRSKYLRRVVDDVLDLSKIEEGKLEVDFVPFSLQRVMDQAVAQVGGRSLPTTHHCHCGC